MVSRTEYMKVSAKVLYRIRFLPITLTLHRFPFHSKQIIATIIFIIQLLNKRDAKIFDLFPQKKSEQMVVALDIMGCVELNKLYSGKRSKLLRKLTYLISLATADYFWCTEDHITS